MADTSEQPHPTPLELQQYIVAQTAGFYAFLHHAVTDYTESGKLPGPVFSAAGKVSGTRGSKATKEPREKRRMTAFNYFVQQKMHEYKESGKNPEPGSSLFTDASKEWTNLGAEEKEHFVAEFKRTHGQDGGSGGAVELPKTPAAAPYVLCVCLLCCVMYVATLDCGHHVQ